ncbi:hypothetical protein [Prosthecobacter sp.]|uniref:hypothetical protein n=1 Tax=Prosthecobacter sp. TaxID=1965333 RepID=UPI0024897164|nr:hypothetical protein [Prosthecobacter sp.]MDI1314210.1 hypothetical protein [Prosthecobacter sp.]
MDEPPEQPRSAKPSPRSNLTFWWFAWIFSTTLLPISLGIGVTARLIHHSSLPPLAGLGILLLHAVSSSKISKQRPGLGTLLWLGGWVLLYVTYFMTCGLQFRN